MPPSRVKDKAAGSTAAKVAHDRPGSLGAGRPCGSWPKREPIVSTGRWNRAAAAAAAVTAISIPGHSGLKRRKRLVTTMTPTPRPSAATLTEDAVWNRAASLGTTAPGSAPASFRPNRSLSWLAAMIRAMPAVKPTVTACGMRRTSSPSRSRPPTASISPDRNTARARPSMPSLATVAETSTMKAPAGPPI